jgi:hypothetical protein
MKDERKNAEIVVKSTVAAFGQRWHGAASSTAAAEADGRGGVFLAAGIAAE